MGFNPDQKWVGSDFADIRHGYTCIQDFYRFYFVNVSYQQMSKDE